MKKKSEARKRGSGEARKLGSAKNRTKQSAVSSLKTEGRMKESSSRILLTPYSLRLQIRNQFPDRLFIGFVKNGRFSQVSLPFRRFRRQDMAGIGPAPLDLSRSRHGKSLRRTPMCLDLWHSITPFVKILSHPPAQARNSLYPYPVNIMTDPITSSARRS